MNNNPTLEDLAKMNPLELLVAPIVAERDKLRADLAGLRAQWNLVDDLAGLRAQLNAECEVSHEAVARLERAQARIAELEAERLKLLRYMKNAGFIVPELDKDTT